MTGVALENSDRLTLSEAKDAKQVTSVQGYGVALALCQSASGRRSWLSGDIQPTRLIPAADILFG
jgi:hypothetical protein